MSLWKGLFGGKPQTPDTPNPGTPQLSALATVLQTFVNSPTPEQKKALLKAHPELLSPKAEEILIYSASIESDERKKQGFEHHRRQLELCRQIGIDAAFTPIPDPPPGGPLGLVLLAFLNTSGLEQKKAMLKSHPQLLGPEAEQRLVQSVAKAENERTRVFLERMRRLLVMSRQVGIDAAFEEVERQRQPLDPEINQHLLKVFGAATAAEMEAVIRADPRVIDPWLRESSRIFFATNGTYGIPQQKIEACLDILKWCDEQGIDATFDAIRRGAAKSTAGPLAAAPNPASNSVLASGEVLNQLIRKFAAGNSAAEVAREATKLIPLLPPLPRVACVLLALVSSVRAEDHAQARQLAVRLNQLPNGRPFGGLPSQVFGFAVMADRSVDPILEALDWVSRQGEGTEEERDAVRRLVADYTAQKARNL